MLTASKWVIIGSPGEIQRNYQKQIVPLGRKIEGEHGEYLL